MVRYAAALAAAMLVMPATGHMAAVQNPPKPAQPPAKSDQVIRAGVELITTDVIVRDGRGQFIADLKKDEFEIYEDGVRQQVVSFILTHGGRVFNVARRRHRHRWKDHPPATASDQRRCRTHLHDLPTIFTRFPQHRRIRDLFKKIRRNWFTKATCSALSRLARRRSPST
jgi:hypothetical protein